METTIYYFSGTGNSLKVSTALSKKLGNCDILPIASCVKKNDYKVNSKQVGFVFPLYYLGLPKIVADFIKNLNMNDVTYVFTVVTRGWPIVGGAIKQMKKLMYDKGMCLDYGAYIHMPMNDITLAQIPSEKSQDKIFGSFNKQINKVVKNISNHNKGYEPEPISFLLEKRNTPFINRVNQMDQFYRVDTSCIGCGICEKVCPVDNIHIEHGIPHWNNQCQMCLACYHYCPNRAIQYGDKGKNTKQYHHPDVSVQQIMNQKSIS